MPPGQASPTIMQRGIAQMAVETSKGHMVQTRQGVRSTQPAPAAPPSTPEVGNAPPSPDTTNEVYVCVEHVSKLYTDDTGRFPTQARSGNQYIMIVYHCALNAILSVPFQSRKDKHRLAAFNTIMTPDSGPRARRRPSSSRQRSERRVQKSHYRQVGAQIPTRPRPHASTQCS